MITQYFDINQRQVIQAPGTLAPASLQPWVYGDNYNLAIYLVGNGQFQTIGANDSLQLMLFQPAATLPEQNLALISVPTINTDPTGFNYYLVNVNLKTTQLAALVQANNTPAKCEFHYIFTPASGERFSCSADVAVTVNPDPSQSATGGTPVPPGYPANPNVFEQVANKNIANGYAGLDPNDHLNPNQIPTDTTLAVSGGKLTVIGGGSGGGNPYVAVVTASFAIPAEGANTPSLTLAAVAPDIISNETVLITDGTSFIAGSVVSISGTTLVVTNNGAPGMVSGTMGANAHVYLGNSSGPVDSTRRGLVQKLPTTTPTKLLYRGDDSFAQANYPDLSNIPTSFPPSPHGSQHISTGNDPIPIVSTVATGLVPARTGAVGTYLDVTGNWSTPATSAGNPFVGSIANTFIVPSPGTSFSLVLTAAITDLVNGMAILVSDGTREVTLITTTVSGINISGTCTGSIGAGQTMALGAHVYLALSKHGSAHASNAIDPIPFATTSIGGLVIPDGSTITVAAGVISAVVTYGYNQGSKVVVNTTTSITSGSPVVWNAASFQGSASWWTSGSNITVPTGQAGLYVIQGQIALTAYTVGSSPSATLGIFASPGGILAQFGDNSLVAPANNGLWIRNLSALAQLSVGAYLNLTLNFANLSAVSYGSGTWMSVWRIY